MKRSIILLVLVMSLVVVSSVFASWTRVNTMGNVNLYVKDYANVTIFPALIGHYPNHAFLESEVGSGTYLGGALLDLGNPGVLGIVVECGEYPVAYAPLNATQKFDLYYGKCMGSMGYGGNIYWYGASDKVEGLTSGNYKQSVGVIGVQAGLEKHMDTNSSLEATAYFEMTSFTNEAGDNKLTEPEGYQTFGVIGRYFYQKTEEFAIVPFAMFQSCGQGYKAPNAGKETDKTTSFMFGSAFDLTPVENVLVVLHVGMSYDSEKFTDTPASGTASENKTTTMALPFYGVGFEAEITKWLTGRFGAVKRVTSVKYDPWGGADGTRTTGTAPGQTYIGAGMNFGQWIFDVQVADNFLHRGPNFLSGYNDNLFPMLSVTRQFK